MQTLLSHQQQVHALVAIMNIGSMTVRYMCHQLLTSLLNILQCQM